MEESALIEAKDEVIISYYLKKMIDKGEVLPNRLLQDVDVFNKNPREVFNSKNPIFVFVKSRTETCGCESGCWRVMGRDKLIKSEETGKILGFKKILKFYEKTKPREYKRIWVMEEYRLASRWKQGYVICKIRLMFETDISFLLAKHFSYLYTSSAFPLSAKEMLPRYEICLADPPEDAYYLQMLIDWPSYYPVYFLLPKDVYCTEPWKLVSLDQSILQEGHPFFVSRTETCGKADGCDGGCWRIIRRDRLIKSNTGQVLGFKRIFKFCEKETKDKFVYRFESGEEDEILTWTMEEYRLAKTKKQEKVICLVKLQFPDYLNHMIRR